MTPRAKIPYDLVAVLLLAVAVGGAVLSPLTTGTPARAALAIVFVLFVPGYTVIATLFPRGSGADGRSHERPESGGIDLFERFVLSFATSVAITVLVGLGLGLVASIRPVAVYASLASITALGTVVAFVRRQRFAPEERFAPRVHVHRAIENLFGASSVSRTVLNVLFVLSILVVAVGVAYSYGPLGGAQQGQDGITEFYLLPGEDTGDLTPSDYPTSLKHERATPLTAVVHNGEGRPMTYTMVVLLQRTDGSDDATVLEWTELYRTQVVVQPDGTRRLPHEIQPSFTGDNLRLVYLLYVGDPPSDPSIRNAYRELHLWVNVTTSG